MLHRFTSIRLAVILSGFVLLIGMLLPQVAFAASSDYKLFGDAKFVNVGHDKHYLQLNSSTHSGAGYGGVDFKIPSKTTFAKIVTLAATYDFTHNSCGGGSPRFQINIGNASAFVYIGPPPNYTGCPTNVWTNSGNLVGPANFVDTSQLPGGTFYDTFASADVKYGSDIVTGIQFVVDAGWFFTDGQQTVLINTISINHKTYHFNKDDDD